MAYGKDRWRGLGAVALTMLLGCFESSVAPMTTTGDSSTGSSEPVCIPGETQTCLCVGGGEGVQACTAEGTGYGECACVGGTSSTGPEGTTGSLDTGTTAADTGVADTGSMDTGIADTGVLDTGEPPGSNYGPCDDTGCSADEVCVGDRASGLLVCAALCNDAADCPQPPREYEGSAECGSVDGLPVCYLPCGSRDDCPGGMICGQSVCAWPFN